MLEILWGNLTQTWQGTWSTKLKASQSPANLGKAVAQQEKSNVRSHNNFIAMEYVACELFTNQTGCFPMKSSQRHKYVTIFYVYDTNAILSAPIKNHLQDKLLFAYKTIYTKLNAYGYKGWLHKLDNETLTAIEEFIIMQHATYQYVPPKMHHANPAEGCANMEKLLQSRMSKSTTSFSIANWCHLTDQADVTLDLLWDVHEPSPISTQSTHWCFPLWLNTNSTTGYKLFCPCETHMTGIMRN